MAELVLAFIGVICIGYWNWRYAMRGEFKPREKVWLQLLFIYHLAFSGIFSWYIGQNGGDAVRYWNLTADVSYQPVDWMDYWGHGTRFLQWLNFVPSKVFGLDFWFGNLLFALVSWLGLRELVALLISRFGNVTNRWLVVFGWTILFLPNLHFWSAGVGKEAWLLLGIGLASRGYRSWSTDGFWSLLGLALAFWVRPVFGMALGLVMLGWFLLDPGIDGKKKAIISLVALLAGALGIWKLSVMMHLEEISLASVQAFSRSQFDFLSGFGARSEIPMDGYSWLEKLWALYFRPLPWEALGFWQMAAAVENLFALGLIAAGIVFGLIALRGGVALHIPSWVLAGVVFGALMTWVHGLTLNNLGIIMRMKSTFMIFVYFLSWQVVVLGIKHIIARNEKS